MKCATCLKQNVVQAGLLAALLANTRKNSMHPPFCAGLFPATTDDARSLFYGFDYRSDYRSYYRAYIAQQFKLLRFYNVCIDGKPFPEQESLQASKYPEQEFTRRGAVLRKYLCV